MKYEIEALSDVDMGYSDRHFTLKKGEKMEVSDAGAEVALSAPFAGVFRISREIPETVKAAEEKKSLMAQPKEKLVKKAERLDIPAASSMKKEPLAEAIVDSKTGGKK
jgi:hypothetical protein